MKAISCPFLCESLPRTARRTQKMGSNSRRERQQTSLPWDPDLEEAREAPPYILLIDNGFPIRRRRRRSLSLMP